MKSDKKFYCNECKTEFIVIDYDDVHWFGKPFCPSCGDDTTTRESD